MSEEKTSSDFAKIYQEIVENNTNEFNMWDEIVKAYSLLSEEEQRNNFSFIYGKIIGDGIKDKMYQLNFLNDLLCKCHKNIAKENARKVFDFVLDNEVDMGYDFDSLMNNLFQFNDDKNYLFDRLLEPDNKLNKHRKWSVIRDYYQYIDEDFQLAYIEKILCRCVEDTANKELNIKKIMKWTEPEVQKQTINGIFKKIFDSKQISEDEKWKSVSMIYNQSVYDVDTSEFWREKVNGNTENFLKLCSFCRFSDWIKITENLNYSEEQVLELMDRANGNESKICLLSTNIDREKIIELNNIDSRKFSINIDSILKKTIQRTEDGKIDYELTNKNISEVYNLMMFNNVPDFIKSFRFFQLGEYYDKTNDNFNHFKKGGSKSERDKIIFTDLFRIALNSDSASLRKTCNILIKGDQIKNKLQGKYFSTKSYDLEGLSQEERAYLEQYADTLFELHNVFSDISQNGKEKLFRTGNIISDLKTLKAQYPDQKGDNLFFDSNMVFREVFDEFLIDDRNEKKIGAVEILESMNSRKQKSFEQNKKNASLLMSGELRLQKGDMLKGISDFPKYIKSILLEGMRAGEYNKLTSHSDATPLDCDFAFISDAHDKYIGVESDYDIIQQTISKTYGKTWIVLKSDSLETDELLGKLEVETYDKDGDTQKSSRYIRTGNGNQDISYIVTSQWDPKFGYEMAMAGVFIPVKNEHDEVVFSDADYEHIREQMKGMRAYTSEPLELSSKVRNIDSLFAIYREVGKNPTYGKTEEEIEADIKEIQEILNGVEDSITLEKKICCY